MSTKHQEYSCSSLPLLPSQPHPSHMALICRPSSILGFPKTLEPPESSLQCKSEPWLSSDSPISHQVKSKVFSTTPYMLVASLTLTSVPPLRGVHSPSFSSLQIPSHLRTLASALPSAQDFSQWKFSEMLPIGAFLDHLCLSREFSPRVLFHCLLLLSS